MPLARLRALGHELSVFASSEILEVDFTARNPVWTWIYTTLIRPLGAIPRLLFGERRPMTTPASDRPMIEYKGKSDISVYADAPEEAKELARRVSENVWYHTFDLGHGIVTPGGFDHAPIVHHYLLPDNLAGKRVLDVACFDGFWAMEFERRGADEVIALDIDQANELDLPPVVREKMTPEELSRRMGNGFRIVHEAKKSNVKRVHCNVYNLAPETAGMFDIVHIGDVLIHLQNPMKALANIRKVTKGYALISDIIDPRLDRVAPHPIVEFRGGTEDCLWWYFSEAALESMIRGAGFRKVERITKFKYGMRGNRQQMWHVIFKASV